MRWQLINCYGTRLKMRQYLYFPRGLSHLWGDNSSTATVLDSRWDKVSTFEKDLFILEMKRCRLLQVLDLWRDKDLYSRSRNYHSRRQKLIDYYGTRTSSPLPKKELFVQEMTSKSTAMALEKTTQDSQWQASWKGNQPIGRQRKKESTIHLNVKKYCSGNTSTKEPKEFQQIF